MSVKTVKSLKDYKKLINSKIVVVKFYATWCGPCKKITPFYHDLAIKYPRTTFLEVDVDEQEDISEYENVSSMPTIVVYMNGTRFRVIKGADTKKIKSTVEEVSNIQMANIEDTSPKIRKGRKSEPAEICGKNCGIEAKTIMRK